MKLVCGVHSPDGSNVNYAVLDLTRVRAKEYLDRMAAARVFGGGDSCGFYALVWWDGLLDYRTEVPDEIVDLFDKLGSTTWVPVPEGVELKDETPQVVTRADTVIVTDDGLYWTGQPKHQDNEVQTPELHEATLQVLLLQLIAEETRRTEHGRLSS